MDIDEISVEQDLQDGVWLDFRDGVQAKIAYQGRRAFLKATTRHTRKIPAHKLEADPSLYHEIGVEVAADAVLLDFRGITEKGKVLANTRENRIKLLQRPVFMSWVNEESKRLSNFQKEALAEDATALKSHDDVAAPVGPE